MLQQKVCKGRLFNKILRNIHSKIKIKKIISSFVAQKNEYVLNKQIHVVVHENQNRLQHIKTRK